jgi:hypothetical protein
MDVFLSPDALGAIEATAETRADGPAAGLLLGHLRGHRYFVEDALPLTNPLPTEEMFLALNLKFNGRVLGYFSFPPDEALRRTVLNPSCYGKILLSVSASAGSGPRLTAFIVEYDEKFHLMPIDLAEE